MNDPLAHIWAKSGKDGRDGEGLTAHTANVLARLKGWRERYPVLHRHTSRPDLWDLAAWACLLHDIGKVASGFQAMLRGGPRFGHRHEALSLVAVGWLDASEETRALVAGGVVTHHRDLPVIREMYPFDSAERTALLVEMTPEDERACRLWLETIGAELPVRFGFNSPPSLRLVDATVSMAEAFRSIAALYERVEAEPADGPFALGVRALRGLVVLADHAGSAQERVAAVRALDNVAGLRHRLEGLFSRPFEYHQEESGRTDGHAILVAPTGSGKTEAALLWAARQREASTGDPSVFYVLPYRASLNAMRARIPKYGIPDGQVVLQHASATSALYRYLLDQKGYTPEVAERVARHETNLGRLMTAPVRVLTPYQLLRAFFGLPGHEAVLTDAAGSIFVLDELHAYDIQRLGMILAAVGHLARDLGARFLAMSATFPSVLRHAFSECVGAEVRTVRATPDTYRRFRRHALRVVDRDLLADGSVHEIVERYRRGEAILAVATTVHRAQELLRRLSAALPGEPIELLHSRFTAEDRASKENALARRVGTGIRGDQSGAALLVATQVVEVSLDIDFDVLFTDPAPIESLFQRFGRVNRGLRGGTRDVIVHSSIPSETGFVYERDVVDRSLEILRPHNGSVVDESSISTWVDAVYEPVSVRWAELLRDRVRTVQENVIRANRPLSSHPELQELFDELFDGFEVVPESKEEEFERLEKEDPLRAAFLRIPISGRQRAGLRRAGRLDGDIARVPYDSRLGLDLTFRDDAS